MRKTLFSLGLLILLCILAGCDDDTIPSGNFKAARLLDPPYVQVYRDPTFAEMQCKTFSVIPYTSLSKSVGFDGILEKQMIFSLRSAVEARGYTFVEPDQSPDFLVTIDGTIPYRATRIKPTIRVVTKWIPVKTTTTTEKADGRGHSTTETTTEQHPVSEVVKVPGSTKGAYYPSLMVRVMNPKTYAELWKCIGVGSSKSADIRLSGQFVLAKMIQELPPIANAGTSMDTAFGFSFAVATVEGNDYYPAVTQVIPESPASRAHLRVEDLIVSVDGISTKNKSWSEVRALFRPQPGKRIALGIQRPAQTLGLKLVCQP